MKPILILLLFTLLFIPNVFAMESIPLPLFGKLNLNLPIPILGMILGLIDGGFNPCALSVVFFLIAYLLSIGSRKKCLMIGSIYALMVFIVYFSFMYGLIKVINIVGHLELIKTVVGIIIITGGIIEIKDFFIYGKWFSLEIPKAAKPTIERLIKAATIPSAIILGFFVSLVEIPCAGAFPFVYLTILAERASKTLFIPYLLWYNVFFALPLLLLTFIFYFGLVKVEKAEKTRLRTRRYMRLVAGLIMLLLGIAMVKRWI